jgi:hypothetical protein
MKNEVLYFLAKMAVALAVVDAFIPCAEHYVKEKAKHSQTEKERTEETQQHQYTNRLTTELPDKDKMHLHPPHYHPPLPLQQQQGYLHTSTDQHIQQQQRAHLHTSTDQQMSADPTNAPQGSGSLEQSQDQEPLVDIHLKKIKIDTFGTLLSHPDIEIALKKTVNQNFDFFRHHESERIV